MVCANSGKKIKFGLNERGRENLTEKVMLEVSLETKQSFHMDKTRRKKILLIQEISLPTFLHPWKIFPYLSQLIYFTQYVTKSFFHCNRRIYYTIPCVRIWPGGGWTKEKWTLNSIYDSLLGIFWGAVIAKLPYGSLMFLSYADFI